MTIEQIIDKWMKERDRLVEKMVFCKEHNLPHERDFIYERCNAINDVLSDLRFDLDK